MRWKISGVCLLFAITLFLSGCDRRQQDWEAAHNQDTLLAYQQFLEKYPEGENVAAARQRIEEIQAQQAWDKAQSEDTIAVYQSYLEKFPAGAHVTTARQRLSELQTQQAWAEAQSKDTITDYENYLAAFPDSAHASEAQIRLTDLQRPQNWFRLKDSTDIAALENYIATYPGTAEARAAFTRVNQLQAEQAAKIKAAEQQAVVGSYTIQLAAYQSRQQAESGKQVLEKRFGELLADTSLVVEPPAGDGGSRFFKLRTGGMIKAEADALCNSLKQQDQDCLVRKN